MKAENCTVLVNSPQITLRFQISCMVHRVDNLVTYAAACREKKCGLMFVSRPHGWHKGLHGPRTYGYAQLQKVIAMG